MGIRLVYEIFERLRERMPERMSQSRDVELRDVEILCVRRSNVPEITLRDVVRKQRARRLRELREPRRPTSTGSKQKRTIAWRPRRLVRPPRSFRSLSSVLRRRRR